MAKDRVRLAMLLPVLPVGRASGAASSLLTLLCLLAFFLYQWCRAVSAASSAGRSLSVSRTRRAASTAHASTGQPRTRRGVDEKTGGATFAREMAGTTDYEMRRRRGHRYAKRARVFEWK